MKFNVYTVDEYISTLSDDRKPIIEKIRKIINENLPTGFVEQISYGMIGYVVPLSLYPAGYHASPGEPLTFMALASQKNHIAVYHMGIYSNKKLMDWFSEEYKKQLNTKLDIGKSCIRFKNTNKIPYDLIGSLCQKMSVDEYIHLYEESKKNS